MSLWSVLLWDDVLWDDVLRDDVLRAQPSWRRIFEIAAHDQSLAGCTEKLPSVFVVHRASIGEHFGTATIPLSSVCRWLELICDCR